MPLHPFFMLLLQCPGNIRPMRPKKGCIMKTSETITSGTSLRELRMQLPSTEGQKTPSIIWFREHQDEIVFSDPREDGAITVYSNGFYTYTEDRGEHFTILRIDGFDHIQYDFVDGTQSIVDESEYLDSSFLVALFIRGKDQWDKNASKRSDYRHKYYLQNNSLDWSEEAAVPSAEDEYFANEQVIAVDAQIEKAFSSLTQRQRQIARLYYDQGMKQEDIAEYLGVCQQSVLDVVKASEKKIKKFFRKCL